MHTPPEQAQLKALGLFLREGVFHAVLEFPGVCLEVALHGVSTLEEAVQALRKMAALGPGEEFLPAFS